MKLEFQPVDGAPYKFEYNKMFAYLYVNYPAEKDRIARYRELCKTDLFFLLYFGLGCTYINHPWVVERIREVEELHHQTVDLWAREHMKTTILTFGLPIQELVVNPDERIGIFSHTRPIAKGFLRRIKLTLEGDCFVKRWFPDIFWRDPKRQAPKWSEDDGLMVRRRTYALESSIEAWGLVDSQPTSKHFTVRIYDDVVTRDSVTTPEMIAKTQRAFEESESLGTDGGTVRICGTHYHFGDLYTWLKKQAVYKVRLHPATDNGKAGGHPVFITRERLDELRVKQGPYVFACQQLLDPVADGEQRFKPAWLKYYGNLPRRLNKYILGDPANEKSKKSDYTVLAVVGIDGAENRYLLDMVRARLSLGERWAVLRDMWLRHPGILRVGYERYGMQADISYFEERQRAEGVYFAITELAGQVSKEDRISRLVPVFESGKFWLPPQMLKPVKADGTIPMTQNSQGIWVMDDTASIQTDMVRQFVEDEYSLFPFATHDDMLDCLARIQDPALGARPPMQLVQPMQEYAVMEHEEAA